MSRSAILFGVVSFALAGVGSYFAGTKAVDLLEQETEGVTNTALADAGLNWASVRANGMRLAITGLAPDESSRFEALETVGNVIQIDRVVDKIVISKSETIAPPEFSLEILRNDTRISLIGLIPQSSGRDDILNAIANLADENQIADMLETADYPVNPQWQTALRFGLDSLTRLPRSKISLTQNQITITAVTESVEEQQETVRWLNQAKPADVTLVTDISSPRPVISPFAFTAELNANKMAVTACSAGSPQDVKDIQIAAEQAGIDASIECKIGLGAPTDDWVTAIKQGLETLSNLKGGSLALTDADMVLIASDEAEQELFDKEIQTLAAKLPDIFSLQATLPPKIVSEQNGGGLDVPEFVATKSPEGLVQLRGVVPSDATQQATDAYAQSLFGTENIYLQTEVDQNLTSGWPLRILTGLEALSLLHHGSLTIRPDSVSVRGVGAKPAIPDVVNDTLRARLGEDGTYTIDVRFDENLFVVDEAPTPQDCERGIAALLTREKIAFAPSSARIDSASLGTITQIADILRKCPDDKFEISGHTDNQGSEELNLDISQRRAESVLSALISQRILTSGISARGYGLSKPIADNATEEGRAANRRIEIKLITEPAPADVTTQDAPEAPPEETENE